MQVISGFEFRLVNYTDSGLRPRKKWTAAHTVANTVYNMAGPTLNLPHAYRQVGMRLDSAFAKIQNAEEFVSTMELELGIQEQWTAATQDYKDFYQENVLTNYSKALDELERLVVMHLFELAKLSTSGTGR